MSLFIYCLCANCVSRLIKIPNIYIDASTMVYVGGWLVGWLVGCVYAFVCMHAHVNEGGLFSQQIPGYLLAPFFLHAHNVALQNCCVCGPWWQLNLISRTINICLLCNWHSFTFGPKYNRNSMNAFSCAT